MPKQERTELSESQATQEVERLLKSDQLLDLGSQAQAFLVRGSRRSTTPTVSEFFKHGRLIQSALAHPDLTRKILAQVRRAEQYQRTQAQYPSSRYFGSFPGTPTSLGGLEYICTILNTAVLEGSNPDLESDMRNKAVVLAALYTEFDITEQVMLKNKTKPDGDNSIAAHLLRRYLPVAEALPKSFKAPLNGRATGLFLDTIYSELDTDTYEAGLTGQAAGVFGPHLRDQFCREYYGEDYDGYAIDDFRGDALLQSKNPTARKVLMNDVRWLAESRSTNPLWHLMSEELIEHLPDELPTDLYSAALKPDHPRHQEARRIMRKFIFSAKLPESAGFLAHITANGDNVFEAVKIDRNFSMRFFLPEVRARQQLISALIAEVYGEPGKKYFGDFIDQFRLHAADIGGSELTVSSNIAPRPELAVRQHATEPRPYLRVVEHLPLADERIGAFMPELSIEQSKNLHTLTEAMGADIRESTVALKPIQHIAGDTVMQITPQPEAFPAMEVTVTNDEYTLTFALNDQLETITSPADVRLQRLLAGLRAQALAIVHDELLAVQEITYGERRELTEPGAKPKTNEKPPRRPTRVHRADRFIVFGEQAEDEDLIRHQVTNASGDQVMLTVDRRPHWSDRAPQLTVAARRLALDQWLQTFTGQSENLRPLLENALLQPTAHRLTIRRILTGLFEQERQGKKYLPSDFPLLEAIETLTKLAEDRYQELLQDYTYPDPASTETKATGVKAAGPLPNIYSMAERMEADRVKMQELGLAPMSIPDRQKSTETYMPFNRYQIPLQLDRAGVGRIRHYTVVRGQTSFESVQTIIYGETTST